MRHATRASRLERKTIRFRRLATPADGNCFFHALRSVLVARGERSTPDASELRRRVAAHMRETADTVAQRIAYRRAKKDGAWSEQEEVVAAASALNLLIKVWEDSNHMWVRFGDDHAPRTVYIYNRDFHFEGLVRLRD